MRKLLPLVLTSLLAAACQGNPVAPGTPPSSAPETPTPTPLPAAPKAVLLLGRGDVKPVFAVNFGEFLFDASQSSGDGLTYLLEFGDGASSTERVVMHRLQHRASQYDHRQATARLTVTDKHGRSDSTEQQFLIVNLGPESFTPGRFAPAWVHKPDDEVGIARILTLTQEGATLGGKYRGPYNVGKALPEPRIVSGTLTEDGGIRARTDDGGAEFSGVVAWGTGHFKDWIVLRLSIKDEMADGAVLDFYYETPPY